MKKIAMVILVVVASIGVAMAQDRRPRGPQWLRPWLRYVPRSAQWLARQRQSDYC